ncbi:hypothetical protein J7I93_18255 [Bacillus sp. ISL-47]|uniref:hypothetical protein n=1 Tax=Bacillus sp. ISL-47 TaxID=2819130 RepID=UPI001BE99A90|nr:hypothetical protein [Bacillus sp. ISL-47]MBT2690114.1 hypothetical protein [Bacillus sp. ISL-47]MBT2711126.1 hypothetical protein [Pseudomonas sp. ISL-84]
MSKTYTDYFNKTAITFTESFIDVKTGNSIPISPKVQEQIEYHSKNQTLNHLILSALHSYLHPRRAAAGSQDLILQEISELKKLIEGGSISINPAVKKPINTDPYQREKAALDLNEVEDVLEAFGG